MGIRFVKFVSCNQWGQNGVIGSLDLINIGMNLEEEYAQGKVYTVGAVFLGFACGINFMIVSE